MTNTKSYIGKTAKILLTVWLIFLAIALVLFGSEDRITLPAYATNGDVYSDVAAGSIVYDYYYDASTEYYVFEVPYNGYYKLELWGASGGSIGTNAIGGKGGYVYAIGYFVTGMKLYIYVGEHGGTGGNDVKKGGGGAADPDCVQFGGSPNATSGGGSTDIRLNGTGLGDRIIVAGGGGGASESQVITVSSGGTKYYADGGAGGGNSYYYYPNTEGLLTTHDSFPDGFDGGAGTSAGDSGTGPSAGAGAPRFASGVSTTGFSLQQGESNDRHSGSWSCWCTPSGSSSSSRHALYSGGHLGAGGGGYYGGKSGTASSSAYQDYSYEEYNGFTNYSYYHSDGDNGGHTVYVTMSCAAGGGGGSSYISGFYKATQVCSTNTTNSYTFCRHQAGSYYYTYGGAFGGGTGEGNTGDGKAKITLVNNPDIDYGSASLHSEAMNFSYYAQTQRYAAMREGWYRITASGAAQDNVGYTASGYIYLTGGQFILVKTGSSTYNNGDTTVRIMEYNSRMRTQEQVESDYNSATTIMVAGGKERSSYNFISGHPNHAVQPSYVFYNSEITNNTSTNGSVEIRYFFGHRDNTSSPFTYNSPYTKVELLDYKGSTSTTTSFLISQDGKYMLKAWGKYASGNGAMAMGSIWLKTGDAINVAISDGSTRVYIGDISANNLVLQAEDGSGSAYVNNLLDGHEYTGVNTVASSFFTFYMIKRDIDAPSGLGISAQRAGQGDNLSTHRGYYSKSIIFEFSAKDVDTEGEQDSGVVSFLYSLDPSGNYTEVPANKNGTIYTATISISPEEAGVLEGEQRDFTIYLKAKDYYGHISNIMDPAYTFGFDRSVRTLYFYDGSGSVSGEVQYEIEDPEIVIDSTYDVSREGMNFLGWYNINYTNETFTLTDLQVTTVSPSTLILENSDAYLYARYEMLPVVVSSSAQSYTFTYNVGSDVTISAPTYSQAAANKTYNYSWQWKIGSGTYSSMSKTTENMVKLWTEVQPFEWQAGTYYFREEIGASSTVVYMLGVQKVYTTAQKTLGPENTVTIAKKPLTHEDISLINATIQQEFDGTGRTQTTLSVRDNNTAGANLFTIPIGHYDVTYDNNVNASENATLTVTAKAQSTRYTGSVSATFTITPKPISSVNITQYQAVTYTGSGFYPGMSEIHLSWDRNGTTVNLTSLDFDFEYGSNTNAGTNAGRVTAVGKGNYSGEKNMYFDILKATSTIDVSGMDKEYWYTGEEQVVDSGAVIGNEEQNLVYSNNTFTTVAEVNAINNNGRTYCSDRIEINLDQGNEGESIKITVRICDCNSFGTVLQDGGETTNIASDRIAKMFESTIDSFDDLGEAFEDLIDDFTLTNEQTEVVLSIGSTEYNDFEEFFNMAKKIYYNSLNSVTKGINYDLSDGAIVGLNKPFIITLEEEEATWCSDRNEIVLNSSKLVVDFCNCNSFGTVLLAGGSTQTSNLAHNSVATISDSVATDFDTLVEYYAAFMRYYTMTNDLDEWKPVSGSDPYNAYNTFYKQAKKLYNRAVNLVSHDVVDTLPEGALVGVNNRFDVLWNDYIVVNDPRAEDLGQYYEKLLQGGYVLTKDTALNPEKTYYKKYTYADLMQVIATLFGYADRELFLEYADYMAAAYKENAAGATNATASGRLKYDGAIYAAYYYEITNPTADGLEQYYEFDGEKYVLTEDQEVDGEKTYYGKEYYLVLPFVFKNNLCGDPVLAYVFVDSDGYMSIWLNDVINAFYIANFDNLLEMEGSEKARVDIFGRCALFETANIGDFYTVLSRLFGYNDVDLFLEYAEAIAEEYVQNGAGVSTASVSDRLNYNGAIYTENGMLILPYVFQNQLLEKPVLVYVIVDEEGNIFVWMNDVTAAFKTANFNHVLQNVQNARVDVIGRCALFETPRGVRITAPATENYNEVYVDVPIFIHKKIPTFQTNDMVTEYQYTGSALIVGKNATADEEVRNSIYYKINLDGTVTECEGQIEFIDVPSDIPAQTETVAGVKKYFYLLTIGVTETANFEAGSVTVKIYVNKGTYSVSLGDMSTFAFTYDGESHMVSNFLTVTNYENASIIYSDNLLEDVPERGYCYVTVSIAESRNFREMVIDEEKYIELGWEETGKVIISPATPTITLTGIPGQVLSGEPVGRWFTYNNGNAITLSSGARAYFNGNDITSTVKIEYLDNVFYRVADSGYMTVRVSNKEGEYNYQTVDELLYVEIRKYTPTGLQLNLTATYGQLLGDAMPNGGNVEKNENGEYVVAAGKFVLNNASDTGLGTVASPVVGLTATYIPNDEDDINRVLNVVVTMTLQRAARTLNIDGVERQYVYTGSSQYFTGAVINDAEGTIVYSPAYFLTVAEMNGQTLTISVAQSANYQAISTSCTILVDKAHEDINTQGIQQFRYTGERYSITSGATLNNSEQRALISYSGSSFGTVAEAENTIIIISAPATDNYLATSVEYTPIMLRARVYFDVSQVNKAFDYQYDPEKRDPNSASYVPNYKGEMQTVTGTVTLWNAEVNVNGEYTMEDVEQTYVFSNNTFITVPEGNALAVRVSVEESANYEASYVEFGLTVNKVRPITTEQTATATYGDTLRDVTTDSGLQPNYSFKNGSLSVGPVGTRTDLTVSYDPPYPDSDNFYSVNDVPVTLIVGKGTPVLSTNNVKRSYTYNGSEQVIDSGATINNDEQTIVYSNNSFTTVPQAEAINRNGGVLITVPETSNYFGTSATVTIIINKAQPIIDISQVPTIYTYTGTEQTVEGAFLVDNDEQELQYSTNTFTTVEEGNRIGVVTIIAVASENYSQAMEQIYFTVQKATQEIDTTEIEQGYTYSGERQYITATVPDSGINGQQLTYKASIGGINIRPDESGRISFVDVLDGNGMTVVIEAGATANYNAIRKTVEIVVRKRVPATETQTVNAYYGQILDDIKGKLAQGYSFEQLLITSVGTPDSPTNISLTYTPDNTDNEMIVTNVEGTLVVSRRPITVRPNDVTATYGDSGYTTKEMTYRVTNGSVVNGDEPEVHCQREEGTIPGSYVITLTASHDLYDITTEEGVYIIEKRPILITMDVNQSYYGEVIPTIGYTITSGNMVFEDELTGTITFEYNSMAGKFYVESTVSHPYYNVDLTDLVYTVKPRPITVHANAITCEYGDETSFTYYAENRDGYGLTGEALVGSDYLGGKMYLEEKDVGRQKILSQLFNTNYDIEYVSAYCTVTPANIGVRALPAESTYGNPITFQYEVITGTVLEGDDIGAVLYQNEKDVGEYDISAEFENENYSVTFTTAKHTIIPRNITVKLIDQERTRLSYLADQTMNNKQYIVTSGSVFEDDDLMLVVTKTDGEAIGEYELTATSQNTNYNVTVRKGVFTITKDKPQIKVDKKSLSVVYDGKVHQVSATVTSGADPEFFYKGEQKEDVYKAVGSYLVRITAKENDLFLAPDAVEVTLVINSAELKDETTGVTVVSSSEGFAPDEKLVVESGDETWDEETYGELPSSYGITASYVIKKVNAKNEESDVMGNIEVKIDVGKRFAPGEKVSVAMICNGETVIDEVEVDEDGMVTVSGINLTRVAIIEKQNGFSLGIVLIIAGALILLLFIFIGIKAGFGK